MRQTKLILAFLLLPLFLFSQLQEDTEPSLSIDPTDLNYSSAFEKQAFSQLESEPEVALFKLSLALDSNMNLESYREIHDDFLHIAKQVKQSRKFDKRVAKKVRFIFDEIHDRYFKLYKLESDFHHIFNNGNFNCITASVLFAHLFEEYKIPYEIKVAPNHAYIVAYPETYSLVLETTNPLKGAGNRIDSREKQKYVDDLVNLKLIDESDMQTSTVDELFNEHFYRERGIDLTRAIGALYSNQALEYMGNHQFIAAYDFLKKSYFLYPREETALFMFMTATYHIDNHNFKDHRTFDLMNDLSSYNSTKINKKHLQGSYEFFLAENMSNRLTLPYVDSIYNKYLTKIEDSAIRANIAYLYNFERGRMLFVDQRFEEAEKYFEVAYALKEGDIDIENMLVESLGMSFSNLREPVSFLSEVKSYESRFKGISNNPRFLDLKQIAYLANMSNEFEEGNVKSAEKYRALFEVNSNKLTNPQLIGELVPMTYSQAAMFYYRRGQYDKAIDVLESGLKISPRSFELSSKLNMLKGR